MKTNPYLNFDGQTEAAFGFYSKAFGTKIEQLTRFKDAPMEGTKLTEADLQKVMHVSLPLGDGHALMGSDVLKALGHTLVKGNNTYTSLHVDSRQEADRLFAALSKDGSVQMPPTDMFWGDYWCSFADKYGVQWMITHTPQADG